MTLVALNLASHGYVEEEFFIQGTASRYNTPALRLVLDTYYWGLDPELEHRLPRIVPYLALVQLADSKSPPAREPNRCRLGKGQLPLAAILRALGQAGYRGAYEVELMGEEIESSDYRDLLTHCQEAFACLQSSASVPTGKSAKN